MLWTLVNIFQSSINIVKCYIRVKQQAFITSPSKAIFLLLHSHLNHWCLLVFGKMMNNMWFILIYILIQAHYVVLYHFDWFGLGCDLWPDGWNFDNVQYWCDLGHGLKFSQPWETEGEATTAWSGNVGEKSLVEKEWSAQSGDLITHWWQLIIEERREDQILKQFLSIILLYLSIWTTSISLIDQSVSSLHK